MAHDPIELCTQLIRCASVTPLDAGAIDVLISALEPLGFQCHDLTFQTGKAPPIRNLYARRGASGRNLCFAGHTDVVPEGSGWSREPFAAEIVDGRLFGRGAVDMKGAIAAFVTAASQISESHESLSLLITGDEEGPAIDGTVRLLGWLKDRGEAIDACVVGEPTNPARLGEMMKVGRRGSLNGTLTVQGVQGHVAYPDRAENPIPRLLDCLGVLAAPLDDGYPRFQPSHLEVTSVDVGNPVTNLIPESASASFNVRFSPVYDGTSLDQEIRRRLDSTGCNYSLATRLSGEAFLTENEELIGVLRTAIESHTGLTPALSTSGGTSDARFIHSVCPVVEFGLVGQSMHKVDEHVTVADLTTLTDIYRDFIRGYFRS